MLKIGDEVTIVWDPLTRRYPTQRFKFIKSQADIMSTFRRKPDKDISGLLEFPKGNTYSEQWDNASPLFRAIAWGSQSYLFLPNYGQNDGHSIHHFKILKVENIIQKLEAGYKPEKTEELQDVLDQGYILEFQIPNFRGGNWKWKIFPKTKGDYEHRSMVSGGNETRGFIDFRKCSVKHKDFYAQLTRSSKNWTSFEELVDIDFRALQKKNLPALSFNDTLPKYFTKFQKSHTPEEAKAFTKHMWGRTDNEQKGVVYGKKPTKPTRRTKSYNYKKARPVKQKRVLKVNLNLTGGE